MNDQDSVAEVVAEIRAHHRRRRFAMKIQQKLDRALESFIRVNGTEWSPDMAEAEREAVNRKVKQLIKDIRAGKGASEFAIVVSTNDKARAPADELRDSSEAVMEKLARQLPIYEWIENVRGAGALGLATIVAEAGDLSRYQRPAQLWSRLGFAPYDGLAGSSWKREKWRPRALTKEEWIEHPFSGERYALIHQIAVWLKNAQWIGKAKTDDGEGRPNGAFGKVYHARRQHTAKVHPDWTPMHGHMDALRVMMKAFLKELHSEWRERAGILSNRPSKRVQATTTDEAPPPRKRAGGRR